MCRSEEDMNMGFNCLAIATLGTESRLLADGHLSNHFHCGVCTDDPAEIMKRRRYSYTRYFNRKYSRTGRMGERQAFISEIKGARHSTASLTYIARQGLHHGLSDTAFGYPHCSANVIFAKELGKERRFELISPRQRNRFLPDDVRVPDKYRMSSSGLLLREDIIDVSYVEEIFHTPQGYLYHMSRKSDSKWEEEQKEDDNGCPPVVLETIEPSSLMLDFKELRSNEYGRREYGRLDDIELCGLIDSFYAPTWLRSSDGFGSIYLLRESDRASMANRIWQDSRRQWRGLPEPWRSMAAKKAITLEQLSRCAVVKPAK